MASDINPYKTFRNVNERIPEIRNLLTKRFDEPTYMTFKVEFGRNSTIWSGTNLLNTNYDRMPHPLFINSQTDATRNQNEQNVNQVVFDRNEYTTIDFLRDSNEFTRAEMLKEFINVWEELQNNFQWYFQSIEGLADLLRVEPGRGKRVGEEVRLTFNMIEGLDQRISYLLNLYRKIAWDDTYQRWVLPDLMRFFDIQIYVTEFRTFHRATRESASLVRTVGQGGEPGGDNGVVEATIEENEDSPLYLKILNGILPTYLIQCEMCEFDINSFDFNYRDRVSIADDPEMSTVSFKVKVGNVNEVTTYPTFNHFLFNDRKINGLERAKEKGIMKDLNGRIINSTDDQGNVREEVFVSTKSGDARYNKNDQNAQNTFFQRNHVTGYPFYESNVLNNIKNSSPNYSQDLSEVDPTEPNTWAGNALTFGKAYGENFIEDQIERAKMTDVFGVSFNELEAVISSKDFIAALGLAKRGIRQSISDIEGPSSQLSGQIDAIFRELISGLRESQSSEATDDNTNFLLERIADEGDLWQTIDEISEATNDEANFILQRLINEKSVLESVDDLSYATDLVSRNTDLPETNTEPGSIEQNFFIPKPKDRSRATDLDGGPPNFENINPFTEKVPSNNFQNEILNQPGDRSRATDLDGGPITYNAGQIIEATPSSQLNRPIERNNINTTDEKSEATNKNEL